MKAIHLMSVLSAMGASTLSWRNKTARKQRQPGQGQQAAVPLARLARHER